MCFNFNYKINTVQVNKKTKIRDFLGGPGVKSLLFYYRGMGSVPGQGTKIPHTLRCSQGKKTQKKKWQKKKQKSWSVLTNVNSFLSLSTSLQRKLLSTIWSMFDILHIYIYTHIYIHIHTYILPIYIYIFLTHLWWHLTYYPTICFSCAAMYLRHISFQVSPCTPSFMKAPYYTADTRSNLLSSFPRDGHLL